MKYPQLVPIRAVNAISDWLESRLEQLGVESAQLYSRLLLSLLQTPIQLNDPIEISNLEVIINQREQKFLISTFQEQTNHKTLPRNVFRFFPYPFTILSKSYLDSTNSKTIHLPPSSSTISTNHKNTLMIVVFFFWKFTKNCVFLCVCEFATHLNL